MARVASLSSYAHYCLMGRSGLTLHRSAPAPMIVQHVAGRPLPLEGMPSPCQDSGTLRLQPSGVLGASCAGALEPFNCGGTLSHR